MGGGDGRWGDRAPGWILLLWGLDGLVGAFWLLLPAFLTRPTLRWRQLTGSPFS